MFSYHLGLEVESPLNFISKAIIFTILMNFSFFICEQIISLNDYVSSCIREIGNILFKKDITFSSLIDIINSNLYVGNSDFTVFSLDGLLKSFISFGIFNLILSYSLRYIMIKVFVLITPFAFLSLINVTSSWFFKAWFKTILSLLFVQILASIILLFPFSINTTLAKNPNDIFTKLIMLGSIYALIKSTDFVKEFMGGISTNISSGFSFMKNTLK